MPFHLSIVTPEHSVVDLDVEAVSLPGIEGEFGVLPGHEPFLTALRPGIVDYEVSGVHHQLAVTTGFAEVVGTEVTILARAAELAKDVDKTRAQSARSRAQQALQKVTAVEEVEKIQDKLARADARLEVTSD